jgi:hypothetical protein
MMSKERRDYIRNKHNNNQHPYYCDWCKYSWPCDVIEVLNELEKWVKE